MKPGWSSASAFSWSRSPRRTGWCCRNLYLPTALMLVGLILRGAAFDFRVKGKASRKAMWDRLFIAGSMLASVCQGWMLGRYVSGFGEGWNYPIFAGAIAIALPMAYALLGATWLVMKTDGELQDKAIEWSKIAWPPMVLGLILISMATPWISETVRVRWFTLPAMIAVASIPITTGIALLAVRLLLGSPAVRGGLCWLPFALLVLVFVLSFLGLSYSIYPFVVIDRLDRLAGCQQPRVAQGHPDRGVRDAAGHYRLHRIFLSRIPGQDHRVRLCMSGRPSWPTRFGFAWFPR